MEVKEGDRVKVDYVLSVGGNVYDTSVEGIALESGVHNAEREYRPLVFEVGSDEMIRGLSNGVLGMSVGEEKEIVVAPSEGYGFYNPDYVRKLPRGMVERQGVDVSPGTKLMINTVKGAMVAVVTSLDESGVTFDLNHDLCDKTLHFKLVLKEILPKNL